MPRTKPVNTADAGAPKESTESIAQKVKAARIAKPKTTGETVTVGFKAPSGLVLRLQKKVQVSMPVMGGGYKDVVEWHPDMEQQTYTINGTATPAGIAPRCMIVHGFAMTPGIPKDFMELWLEQNRNSDMVKNGVIIVHEAQADANAEAKEMRDLKSGLEPIDPKNDTRMPRKPGTRESAITTGDEQPRDAA